MEQEGLAEELAKIVGAQHVCTAGDEVQRRTRNTLGLERPVLGLVYPQTTDEVQAIVELANRRGLALYPYSTAKNIGYGERMPASEHNLIVDLGRMDRILAIDGEEGWAEVEPGVTQAQLSDALRERKLPFFADVTGSGRDSSLVGNFAEGGIGTTPKGDRRKQITCVRGVLGSGERFDSGCFPGGLGPDLAGLFVQSNLGIVTQLRIPLNPAVEEYRSFTIQLTSDADLVELVELLREARQQGTLTSQVVIMNALDALFTSGTEIPEAFRGRTLTNADAEQILSTPLSRFGEIAAIGALYGSKAEVRAKCRTLRRALRRRLGGRARVLFMNERRLEILTRVFSCWPLGRIPLTAGFAKALESYRATHGLMQGIPSDVALIGLMGAVRDTYEDRRLMWYSSHVSSRAREVGRFTAIASRCYAQHGFAYPIEMLLVTANDLIAIQKIDWRLGDAEEEARARRLYASLSEQLVAEGILPYRLGVQSQPAVAYGEERARLLSRLKRALDPNGVIAPGRYGIG